MAGEILMEWTRTRTPVEAMKRRRLQKQSLERIGLESGSYKIALLSWVTLHVSRESLPYQKWVR
jgi:hypothetical protein